MDDQGWEEILATNPTGTEPLVERIVEALVALYTQSFGGKSTGRYRISPKFLRQIAGRRRLPPALLDSLTEALFERGYVFIDAETYFVVLEQKVFNSYRRVTAAANERVLRDAKDRGPGDNHAGDRPYPVPERTI